MVNILFALLAIIVFLIIANILMHQKMVTGSIAVSVLAIAVVIAVVFKVAPIELGYSRVPDTPESFETRLEIGVVYEVVAKYITAGGDDTIFLVWAPLNEYRAIRVKTSSPIPTRFTLIDGRPVEVK